MENEIMKIQNLEHMNYKLTLNPSRIKIIASKSDHQKLVEMFATMSK
jgi:hypothetical protein